MNRFRLISTLVTALIFGAWQPAAQASNDGQLCDGPFGLVLCGSLMAVQALTPKSARELILDAARQGELERLQWLLQMHPGAAKPFDVLASTVYYYRGSSGEPSIRPRQLAVMAYLADLTPDINEAHPNTLLQELAERHSLYKDKRLELVKLLLAHGASARAVNLTKFVKQNISSGIPPSPEDVDVLQRLLDNGADPNLPDKDDTAYGLLVQRGQYQLGETMLAHGASPDALPAPGRPGVLLQLARNCKRQEDARRAPQFLERQWKECQLASQEQARFLVSHGADIHGRVAPGPGCATPYDEAVRNGNLPLAEALQGLGGRPCGARGAG